MTIPVYTFPTEIGFEQISFDPVIPGDLTQMEGRRSEMLFSGTPYWIAQYQSVNLERNKLGKAEAFYRRMKSRGGVFRAYDLMRPRLIEYLAAPLSGTRAGGGAFDGTATLSAINNPNSITVQTLPAGLKFREGDYVEIREDDLVVSLHSIEADAQADGSGSVTLSIDMPLDLQHFTTAAVVNFEKACCLMQPFGWSAPKSMASRVVSFSAQEVFFYEA